MIAQARSLVLHGIGEFLGDCSLSLFVSESEVSHPLSVLRILLDKGTFVIGLLVHGLSSWLLISWSLLSIWVCLDGCMNFLINILAGLSFGGGQAFFPLREVAFEFSWVFLLH